MEMMISVCGIDCTRCNAINGDCPGCRPSKGKLPWVQEELGRDVCPMYACVEKHGIDNCGLCEECPCQKWKDFKEPGLTDEQHAINMATRDYNLRGVNGVVIGEDD